RLPRLRDCRSVPFRVIDVAQGRGGAATSRRRESVARIVGVSNGCAGGERPASHIPVGIVDYADAIERANAIVWIVGNVLRFLAIILREWRDQFGLRSIRLVVGKLEQRQRQTTWREL